MDKDEVYGSEGSLGNLRDTRKREQKLKILQVF